MSADSILILLAEDDDGHAHLVQRNLKRAGLINEIVRVKDGQQALDYVHRRAEFANRPADRQLLVVLDINMPRVDGVEVLQQLKTHAHASRLPVIMLTTTDDPREVARCYQLGCSVYMTKPVEYSAFIEAIRRLGLLLEIVQIPVESYALPPIADETHDFIPAVSFDR